LALGGFRVEWDLEAAIDRLDMRTWTPQEVSRIVASPIVESRQSAASHSGRSLELAKAAAQAAAEQRGRDILILDLRDVTSMCDFFVLATGASRRQLHAMSEEIDHKLEGELHDRRLGIEGYQASRWILLDYGDVVIHLFDPETRDYYALDELWAGAKRVPFEPVGVAPPPTSPR
jgi:ribosome-associated protein